MVLHSSMELGLQVPFMAPISPHGNPGRPSVALVISSSQFQPGHQTPSPHSEIPLALICEMSPSSGHPCCLDDITRLLLGSLRLLQDVVVATPPDLRRTFCSATCHFLSSSDWLLSGTHPLRSHLSTTS
uniref:Uncharacterized protein n=1 Tax=Molossus molossus TaxID=27622 RepID=A0A7J8BYI2_MOLMO|nr:hypothetical protein HJG59_010058 [Molossus molossus]